MGAAVLRSGRGDRLDLHGLGGDAVLGSRVGLHTRSPGLELHLPAPSRSWRDVQLPRPCVQRRRLLGLDASGSVRAVERVGVVRSEGYTSVSHRLLADPRRGMPGGVVMT